MKKTMLFLFVVLCVTSVSAQMGVRTETTSNLYQYYSAATTGDTLYTAAAQVSGGSVDYPGVQGGSIVGILVGEPVASDTIIVKNGVGTVATIVQASSGAVARFYPLTVRADTSLIVIQKKASKTTVLFRLKY